MYLPRGWSAGNVKASGGGRGAGGDLKPDWDSQHLQFLSCHQAVNIYSLSYIR